MDDTKIYVLECRGGKYYVGKTDDVERRFRQHLSGNGSWWTQKHKPIRILKIVPNTTCFQEDTQVKELMLKHGIDNVRGGSYCQEVIDEDTLRFLKKELYGATDCCSRCGRNTHFVKDCWASRNVDGKIIEDYEDACYRCGRDGHYASDCYAKRDINGKYIN